jgi:hypothetical protein
LMAAFLRFFAKKVTANICPFEPFVMPLAKEQDLPH